MCNYFPFKTTIIISYYTFFLFSDLFVAFFSVLTLPLFLLFTPFRFSFRLFPFLPGKVILRKNLTEWSHALSATASYIQKHFLSQLLLAQHATINSILPVFILGLKVAGKVNASFASSLFFVEITGRS